MYVDDERELELADDEIGGNDGSEDEDVPTIEEELDKDDSVEELDVDEEIDDELELIIGEDDEIKDVSKVEESNVLDSVSKVEDIEGNVELLV